MRCKSAALQGIKICMVKQNYEFSGKQENNTKPRMTKKTEQHSNQL